MTVSGNEVDRDRLIESLANCLLHERNCHKCLYSVTENDCRDAMLWDVLELLKEQENQLTMKYEEGFHDGYKQAMRESDPCYECQEFSCDDCKFKDNRTVK